MKLLLDKNLPHKLRQFLPGHNVFTTAFMNWGGTRNGQLLRNAAAAGFDALLTVDIEPHIPAILNVLQTLTSCSLVKVG